MTTALWGLGLALQEHEDQEGLQSLYVDLEENSKTKVMLQQGWRIPPSAPVTQDSGEWTEGKHPQVKGQHGQAQRDMSSWHCWIHRGRSGGAWWGGTGLAGLDALGLIERNKNQNRILFLSHTRPRYMIRTSMDCTSREPGSFSRASLCVYLTLGSRRDILFHLTPKSTECAGADSWNRTHAGHIQLMPLTRLSHLTTQLQGAWEMWSLFLKLSPSPKWRC